jgi:hypothetical protein
LTDWLAGKAVAGARQVCEISGKPRPRTDMSAISAKTDTVQQADL